MFAINDLDFLTSTLSKKSEVTIGVLADTHLPFRAKQLPAEIFPILRDVDLFLHAGDVDQSQYLADLLQMAPLYAVRGNLHFTDFSHGGMDLPLDLQISLAGYNVVVNHGGWPDFWSLAGDWFMEKMLDRSRSRANSRLVRRLLAMYPRADVILFGHTHLPYRAWHSRVLVLNPGAVCRSRNRMPSVARLVLKPGRIQADIIPLYR